MHYQFKPILSSGSSVRNIFTGTIIPFKHPFPGITIRAPYIPGTESPVPLSIFPGVNTPSPITPCSENLLKRTPVFSRLELICCIYDHFSIKMVFTFKKVYLTFKKTDATFKKVDLTFKKGDPVFKKVNFTFKKADATFGKADATFGKIVPTLKKVALIFKKVMTPVLEEKGLFENTSLLNIPAYRLTRPVCQGFGPYFLF